MQRFHGKAKLGDWDAGAPWVRATVYQADKDGFVLAFGAAHDATLQMRTSDATPPVTIRIDSGGTDEPGYIDHSSGTMPVKKGDYWEIDSLIALTIFWIPLV